MYERGCPINLRGKLPAIFPNSSNESLNPAQQNVYNELPKYERHGQHSRPLSRLLKVKYVKLQ